jgi:hypothetical protein
MEKQAEYNEAVRRANITIIAAKKQLEKLKDRLSKTKKTGGKRNYKKTRKIK